MTLQKNFTEDLNDPESDAFKNESASFCASVEESYKSTNLSDEYSGCVVTGFE